MYLYNGEVALDILPINCGLLIHIYEKETKEGENENKAGYTATKVACRWTGAGIK